MNRRGFLKVLGGAAIAPLAAKLPVAEATTTLYHKATPVAQITKSGVTTPSEFAGALWPGIDEWYGKEYGKYVVEWKSITTTDDVTARALAEAIKTTREKVAANTMNRAFTAWKGG